MVYNVQPKYRNTLRGTYSGDQYDASVQPKYRNTPPGTYAGDQYDASGRQRGTLLLYMGPTRAINGTPMVDNVTSRHSSNSLKASLAESSAQRKCWKNNDAKIQERRQRKGKKSSEIK